MYGSIARETILWCRNSRRQEEQGRERWFPQRLIHFFSSKVVLKVFAPGYNTKMGSTKCFLKNFSRDFMQ